VSRPAAHLWLAASLHDIKWAVIGIAGGAVLATLIVVLFISPANQADLKGALKWVLPSLLLGAALTTAVFVLPRKANQPAPAKRRVPGEYLYLDSDRVNAYLGQLNVGLSPNEERTLTKTSAAQAQLGAGGVTLGGSRQEQNFVRAVVTPDAADRFYDLRKRLDDLGDITHIDPSKDLAKKLPNLEEGDFVEFARAHLLVPPYASVLPKANYAPQIGHPQVKPHLLAPVLPTERARLQAYFDLLSFPHGKGTVTGRIAANDFRIPFLVEDRTHSTKVFIPMRNSKLALEPGLMSGDVKILAKVTRVLTTKNDNYFDVQTVISFGHALQQADPLVLRRLHIRRRGKRSAQAVVTNSATLTGPALVAVPIAAYK
jgi:hypothetical protein